MQQVMKQENLVFKHAGREVEIFAERIQFSESGPKIFFKEKWNPFVVLRKPARTRSPEFKQEEKRDGTDDSEDDLKDVPHLYEAFKNVKLRF